MIASTTRILVICILCSPFHRAQASDKSASDILAEIDAIRDAMPTAKNDPQLMAKLRDDPAAREDLRSRQLAAQQRVDELTWSLYTKYPDNERLPKLLRSRWMYRMRTQASTDETLAEIDRVLAEAKNPRLVVDVAFLRAEATLRKYHGRPATEFVDHSMPSIESAIARAPKDVRGAALLYAIMTESKDLPEQKTTEVGDRILRDYPDTSIAALVRKSRIPKATLGKALTLDFKDAIGGSDVSLAAMRGRVVVIDFWATWCVPCVSEMPKLKDLYSKYHDQGVEFVGINLDRSPKEGGLDRLRKFVADNMIPWPQHYQGADGAINFSDLCGVQAIPTTFVLDKAGNLASIDAHGKLDQVLKELLK